TCDSEGQPDDIGLARSPIAVKNRSRAFPIDVARTLNVSWYQIFPLKRSVARATRRFTVDSLRLPCPLMPLTRLAVGLEPLNALDAAHRSPPIPPAFPEGRWFPR